MTHSAQDQNHTSCTTDEFECPICGEHFSADLPANITHCGHIFCGTCLYQWFVEFTHRECPICRTTQQHQCGHLCYWSLYDDHPPIKPPETRELQDTCIDCALANISKKEMDDIIAKDVVYQNEETIALMKWNHIFNTMNVQMPEQRERLEQIKKQRKKSYGRIFKRLKKELEMMRW